MDDGLIALGALFFSWMAFSGLIWQLFERIEKAATDESKEITVKWMLNLNPGTNLAYLLQTFGNGFDSVFGKEHFSSKCFYRSSVASVFASLVVTLIWVGLRPDEADKIVFDINTILSFLIFVIWLVFINVIPDYISLLQTRLIIKQIKYDSSNVKVWLWLTLDLIITFILSSAVWVVLVVYFRFPKMDLDSTILTFIVEVWDIVSVFIPVLLTLDKSSSSEYLPLGILFYSTFLTSIWLWLYIASGYLSKKSISLNLMYTFLKKSFFRKEQPFISLGMMSIIILSVIYIALMPFILVFS